MRFNGRGDLTGGVGGAVDLWVWPFDASTPAHVGLIGGGSDWATVDRIVTQIEAPQAHLIYLDRATGWAPAPCPQPTIPGANWLRGTGTGSWGATLASPHQSYGIEYGTYFEGGHGNIIEGSSAGLIWSSDPRLPPTVNFESVRQVGRVLCYCTYPGPRLQVFVDGLPIANLQTHGVAQYSPLAFEVGGALFVWYYCDELGTVLHRADDASHGVHTPNAWSKTVYEELPLGRLWLGFAAGEAETAAQARRVPLDALPWGPLAPKPPDPPIDPPVDPPVDPPIDPPIQPEPPMSYTVSLSAPTMAATVNLSDHPDEGFKALQNTTSGKYLTLDPGDGTLRWSDHAGAWERFLDGGNCWIAPRDGGKTWMLAKGTIL